VPLGDELDPLVYGGEHMPTIEDSGEGVGRILIAPDKLLSNEFEMDAVAPFELAENQDTASVIITFKGVDIDTGLVKAATVVMSAEGLKNLIKLGRMKYNDIPLEFR
jgi:hypothetical protein